MLRSAAASSVAQVSPPRREYLATSVRKRTAPRPWTSSTAPKSPRMALSDVSDQEFLDYGQEFSDSIDQGDRFSDFPSVRESAPYSPTHTDVSEPDLDTKRIKVSELASLVYGQFPAWKSPAESVLPKDVGSAGLFEHAQSWRHQSVRASLPHTAVIHRAVAATSANLQGFQNPGDAPELQKEVPATFFFQYPKDKRLLQPLFSVHSPAISKEPARVESEASSLGIRQPSTGKSVMVHGKVLDS